MIKSVTFEKTIYNDLPHKFEAGTPDIAGAIGLGAAIDYVSNLGMGNIQAYERELLEYGTECLSSIEGLSIIGTAKEKGAVLSFVMEGIHPTTSGLFWTWKASPSGPAIIAPSQSWTGLGFPPRPGRPWDFTTQRKR